MTRFNRLISTGGAVCILLALTFATQAQDASSDAPRPVNPVCNTKGATKLLLQLDMLFHVAGKQQEQTSLL